MTGELQVPTRTVGNPIQGRGQFFDPKLRKWVKFDSRTGEILGIKANGAYVRVPEIAVA